MEKEILHFSAIAKRYDFLNHLLSLNIDRGWRRKLVEYAGVKPDDRILDVCTGTGDIALRFAHRDGASEIIGIDLSMAMLDIAVQKIEDNGLAEKIKLLKGDTLNLPFEDNSFDVVSIGFGLRNTTNRNRAISEMVRILKEGGRLVILEFSPPEDGIFGLGYRLYLNTIIPFVGGIISGSREAYRYFSTSIADFLKPEEIKTLMVQEGLRNVDFEALTKGIAHIYRGEK